jgi:hypothetical protein
MITIDSKTPSNGYSEPVSLNEAQVYFRNEESGGIEDDLILSCVSAAREYLEQALNRSLVPNNIELTLLEGFKGYLPYGAVDGNVTFSNGAIVYGTKYPYVKAEALTTATYQTAAYQNAGVKQAVLELAYFYYTRGEESQMPIPAKVQAFINNHTRNELA